MTKKPHWPFIYFIYTIVSLVSCIGFSVLMCTVKIDGLRGVGIAVLATAWAVANGSAYRVRYEAEKLLRRQAERERVVNGVKHTLSFDIYLPPHVDVHEVERVVNGMITAAADVAGARAVGLRGR